MQLLTAAPRDGLTDSEVSGILTAEAVEVTAGCELLNRVNVVVQDISEQLAGGGEIRRNNYADVHGTCRLNLTRKLVWGVDRVRPYMIMKRRLPTGTLTARFNLGVYVLTTPEAPQGITPVTYEVEGYDLLNLLQASGPGDTYVLEPTTTQNFALGKTAVATEGDTVFTFSQGTAAQITNGNTATTDFVTHQWGSGPPYSVTVDLQECQTIDRVKVWHYHGDGRTYNGTKTEVSPDGIRWTTVFDSAVSGTYSETAAGRTTSFSPQPVRFIRDWLQGWTGGTGNHWVEIQAYRDVTLTYHHAIRQIVEGAGLTLLLDGSSQSTAIPSAFVWALTQNPTSHLRIVNDLLAQIGYRGLWIDQDGYARSGPYTVPSQRSVEWTFDTADTKTNLVGEDRSENEDMWSSPNWWRFIRTNMTVKPVEGSGIYTVSNEADGPASQKSLGRIVRKVMFVEAADQTSLVAQGDAIVSQDKAVVRTYDLDVDPLPLAGHFDVVRLIDGGRNDKCQVMEWSLPLDGAPGRWVLEVVEGG